MMACASVFVLALLARLLLQGTTVDLGTAIMPWASGLLALAVGAGLWSRRRIPYLSDGLGVALLVPARGLLADAVLLVLPVATWSAVVAAVVSLVPVGYALGRQVGRLVGTGIVGPLFGWFLAEVAVTAGALSYAPVWFTGLLAAALLLVLVEWQGKVDDEADAPASASAAMIGVALTLLVLVLARLIPAYVAPPVQVSSQLLGQVLLVVALVAVPTTLFVGAGVSVFSRTMGALGGLALAWTMLATLDALRLYESGADYFSVSQQLHNEWAVRFEPFTNDWRVWVMSVPALALAALGVTVGSLRGRWAGPFAVGVGVGCLAEWYVELDAALAPAALVVAASGAALVSVATSLVGRHGLWFLPVAVVPFTVVPPATWPAFDGIRHIGEFEVSAFGRTTTADFSLAQFPAGEGNFGYRLRYGGVDLHDGHLPVGPYGSVGRLTRVFAGDGPALVLGPAAELLAADLLAAGRATEVEAASPVPIDERTRLILVDELDLAGMPLATGADPVLALRAAGDDAWATILIAPSPDEVTRAPGPLFALENLRRAARRLTDGGRCLAWLDTSTLDARALRARVAVFGAVFGERAAAFVELRELDGPFVLLVGWRDEAGAPTVDEVRARFGYLDPAGRRTRLSSLRDLGAILLLDGARIAALADEGPVHRRARPVTAAMGRRSAGAAIRPLYTEPPDLASVVEGAAGVESHDLSGVLAGLDAHTRYSYHLDRLRSQVLEVAPDIDWDAFAVEVEAYAEAAGSDPENPALHLTLAALLEPLADEGELTRFDEAFMSAGGLYMEDPRLGTLWARVLEEALQDERAAAQRARVEEFRRRYGEPVTPGP